MRISSIEGSHITRTNKEQHIIRGKGNHVGSGVGKTTFWESDPASISTRNTLSTNETERYFEARRSHIKRLRRLYGELRTESDAAWIFLMQITLLCDSLFTITAEELLSKGKSAAETVMLCRDIFYNSLCVSEGGENLKSLSADVEDVCSRLLNEITKTDVIPPKSQSILLSYLPLPSYVAEWRNVISGVVECAERENGALRDLISSFGLPYLLTDNKDLCTLEEKNAIIDSDKGCLYINPDINTLTSFAERKKELLNEADLERFSEPVILKNAKKLLVFAEINTLDEFTSSLERTADGIERFLNEDICIKESSTPDEEILFDEYRRAAEAIPTKPVIINGISVTGTVHLESVSSKDNGEDALYVLYDNTLRIQLRAIMRAAVYGTLFFVLPKSERYSDLTACAALLDELSAELYEEDREFSPVTFGAIIDSVPSAIMCDKIIEECDFLIVNEKKLSKSVCANSESNQNHGEDARSDCLYRLLSSIADTVQKKKKKAILSFDKNGIPEPLLCELLCKFWAISIPAEALIQTKRKLMEFSKSLRPAEQSTL